MRRQMAAARAMTFTSVVNDSMTTSPLYLMALQGRGDRLPVDVIVARRAAVAAAGVEVGERFAGFADRFALVLLLDVHVERVEVELQRFAADVLDHLQTLVAGVDEVGLEAVQRFEANLTPVFLGVFAQRS